jgi:hypothetical protein
MKEVRGFITCKPLTIELGKLRVRFDIGKVS